MSDILTKSLLFTITMFLAIILWQCADKVQDFGGFDYKETNYLLGGSGGKAWQRTARLENGIAIDLNDCETDNYLLFFPVSGSDPSKLVRAFNLNVCTPESFCAIHPDFCNADTMNCAADTAFCNQLTDDLLYLGSWKVQQKADNTQPVDTLLLTIGKNTIHAKIERLTSMYATFLFREEQAGEVITVEEEYYHDNKTGN